MDLNIYISIAKFFSQGKLLNKSSSGLFKRRYCGKKIICGEKAQELLKTFVESDQPCMISRYGSTELRCICGEMLNRDIKKSSKIIRELLVDKSEQFKKNTQIQLCSQSGFFTNEENYDNDYSRFTDIVIHASKNIDALGVWFNLYEDYMIKSFMTRKDDALIPLTALEPYYWKNGWTSALKGKKVLIIHPYADTIKKQYKIKDKLFGFEVLPDFELIVFKSVQTLANQKDDRFESWFDALDYMAGEINKIDYDIALIGCGAYGMPLASKIKEQGKKAIHIGGSLQIFFGIKGKRWDNIPEISKFYNEYWVRPSENEKIGGLEKVEDGCYW